MLLIIWFFGHNCKAFLYGIYYQKYKQSLKVITTLVEEAIIFSITLWFSDLCIETGLVLSASLLLTWSWIVVGEPVSGFSAVKGFETGEEN